MAEIERLDAEIMDIEDEIDDIGVPEVHYSKSCVSGYSDNSGNAAGGAAFQEKDLKRKTRLEERKKEKARKRAELRKRLEDM